MNQQVTITNSAELKNLYDVIIDAVEDGMKVHLLKVGHRCSTEPIFETFIENKHPTIRCIFISPEMIQEFLVMNTVIRRHFKTVGLVNICPSCGADPSN